MNTRAAAGLFLLCVSQATTCLAATPVSVARVADIAAPRTYDAPAVVQLLNSPQLASRITGTVESIGVRVGDRVSAGEVLVTIECSDSLLRQRIAQAGSRRARAQLVFADAQLERARNLRRQKSVSEELVEQRTVELASARADLDLQKAQLEQAELDVRRCTVRAPFDAVVRARLAEEGALASPGTPLLELMQTAGAELSAQIRTDRLDSLGDASTPVFRYGGQDYPVTLRTLLPLVDGRTGTREARLAFDGANPPAGAPGRLLWQAGLPTLPADLLVERDGRLGLFLARNDGKAVFHHLPDARPGEPVPAMLPPGSRVVTEGRHALVDGEAISYADAEPDP